MENYNPQKIDPNFPPLKPVTPPAGGPNPADAKINPAASVLTAAPAKPDRSQAKFNFKTFLLYIALVGAGIGIAKLAFDYLTPQFSPTAKTKTPPATTQTASRTKKAMQVSSAKAEPAVIRPVLKKIEPIQEIKKKIRQTVTPYILSGVYFEQGKGYALINNQILEEGDSIGEATVIKIVLEEVDLKTSEKTLKLTTRGK